MNNIALSGIARHQVFICSENITKKQLQDMTSMNGMRWWLNTISTLTGIFITIYRAIVLCRLWAGLT